MSVWGEVKPSVLEHKGKEVAAQFQESLDTQVVRLDSKNYTDLTNEARNALEIVDALEGLY
jgi:nicotinic acid phosphoribosyltransferase